MWWHACHLWHVSFKVVNIRCNCCGNLQVSVFLHYHVFEVDLTQDRECLAFKYVHILEIWIFWLPQFCEHSLQYNNSNTSNVFGGHVNPWWILECYDITTSWEKKSNLNFWCWVYTMIDYQNIILENSYNIVKIISAYSIRGPISLFHIVILDLVQFYLNIAPISLIHVISFS